MYGPYEYMPARQGFVLYVDMVEYVFADTTSTIY